MYLDIASKEEEGIQNVAGVMAATVGQSPGEETPRSKARWVATARDEDVVFRYVPVVNGAPTETRAPSTAPHRPHNRGRWSVILAHVLPLPGSTVHYQRLSEDPRHGPGCVLG
jgi:hypothetical protein